MQEIQNKISKLSVVRELWSFLMIRKKWWLVPLVVLLLIFGILMIFAESSALTPLIYTIF